MRPSKDPGLGTKFSLPVNRLLNLDGTYNITRLGGIKGIRDFYPFLRDCSWPIFLAILFLSYVVINTLFALIYLAIGLDGLVGIKPEISPFWNAFFFSSQTFTTVGYGGIHPSSFSIQFVSGLEAFIGLLSLALATGLLYGRFSRPNAKIVFSDKILLSRLNDSPALMFKMVNLRNNVLLRTRVSCILILDDENQNSTFNKSYHRLNLETDSILFFPLTWTVVHKIDEESPLFGLSLESIKARNVELIVFLETFDEKFVQEILQKHSYAGSQWAENLKFDLNFGPLPNGTIEVRVNDLNKTIPL
jgi:inward rectifier potassium channel